VLQETETKLFLAAKRSQSYIWAGGTLSLANLFHFKKMPVSVPHWKNPRTCRSLLFSEDKEAGLWRTGDHLGLCINFSRWKIDRLE